MYATQPQAFSFSPVDLASHEIIDSRLRTWGFDNSEYSFTTLFLWQPGCNISYAIEDDVLFIRFQCKRDYEFMLAPIPSNRSYDYRRALEMAMSYFAEKRKPFIIRSITPRLRDRIEEVMPGSFSFEHEPDTDDYVYNVEDLISLSGKKYHGKRNHINKFLAENDYAYEIYMPEKHKDECMELNAKWHENKDAFIRGMDNENNAMERALTYTRELGLSGAVVRIGGKVEAFTIGEQLNNEMALIHMEKANSEIQGLYPFINQQFLKESWSHLKYVNREEDMGIEGLRKAKLSYHPCKMIEKYKMTITR